MLHAKIKDLLNNKVPNITNFLKDVSLPLSYLGIRYFLTGKQDEIGKKGLNNIIDKLGYEMVLVPVKGLENKAKAIELQDIFIDDFDKYLDKFGEDKKIVRRTAGNSEPLAIESLLTGLDTSAPIHIPADPVTESETSDSSTSDSSTSDIKEKPEVKKLDPTAVAIDLGITMDDLF